MAYWTADFGIDTPGVSIQWQFAFAGYSDFANGTQVASALPCRRRWVRTAALVSKLLQAASCPRASTREPKALHRRPACSCLIWRSIDLGIAGSQLQCEHPPVCAPLPCGTGVTASRALP